VKVPSGQGSPAITKSVRARGRNGVKLRHAGVQRTSPRENSQGRTHYIVITMVFYDLLAILP